MLSVKEEILEKKSRRDKVVRLLENPDFKDIFLEYYLKTTMHDLMYREGSSNGVMKNLDARKNLNDFIYDIIDNGKIADEQLKG